MIMGLVKNRNFADAPAGLEQPSFYRGFYYFYGFMPMQ